MHISKWIAHIRKSARPKSMKSPKIAQVVAIALVALIAVAGLVLAAYQGTPKAATPVVQPAATTTQSTAPVQKTTAKKPAEAHGASGATAQTAEAVTITGCLEQDHDGFRLKDTEGVDAPKSRSWKTGFIKKRAATLTLVDGKNRLKLANHVGERVTVKGMLLDRDLEGRSISRVANTCN
jgi:hypothetical protein